MMKCVFGEILFPYAAGTRGFWEFKIMTCLMTVSTIVVAVVGPCERAGAAGQVLHQDCLISWNANSEPDLAGYHVYVGRLPGVLTQKSDVEKVTQIPCSRVGAATNGQWFVAITAYDTSGNESTRPVALPFELAALPFPAPLAQISEPVAVQLTVKEPGFQLA